MDCHPPLPSPHRRIPQSTPLTHIISQITLEMGFRVRDSGTPRGLTPGRFYGKLNVVLGFRYRREQMNSLATFLGYILVTGLVVYLMVTL